MVAEWQASPSGVRSLTGAESHSCLLDLFLTPHHAVKSYNSSFPLTEELKSKSGTTPRRPTIFVVRLAERTHGELPVVHY